MADTWDSDRVRKLIVRGLGWCLCLTLWTVALLTIYPAQIGQEITPEALRFPAAKCLHVSAYAFLTGYLQWLSLGRWRWLLLAFLSLHTVGTEFGQLFVPGRHGQFSDVLIDHIGLALGIALTWRYWLPRLNRYGRYPLYRDPTGNTAKLAHSPSDHD